LGSGRPAFHGGSGMSTGANKAETPNIPNAFPKGQGTDGQAHDH
jgi:hypothetical protein